VAEVLHLFQALTHGQPVTEFEEVFAVENKGFENCVHGRKDSSRQVLLMDFETLSEFDIGPGRVKENITTRGVPLRELLLGQKLRVGAALLEITKPCTVCHLIDEIREGLGEAMRGHRGVLCRVIQSGRIRRGDALEVLAPQSSDEMQTRIHESSRS
jgi:MOSC domain-containing protein YiiM